MCRWNLSRSNGVWKAARAPGAPVSNYRIQSAQHMTYSAVHCRPSLPRVFISVIFVTMLLAPLLATVGDASAQTPQAFPQGSVGDMPQVSDDAGLSDRLRRAEVNFDSSELPGTVIIDTGNTSLYYVLGPGRAIRYRVGVGRDGFTWSGVQSVSRKAEWPDWRPPAQMIARQPYLPRFMAGGPSNPLGARAIYLGSSEYRIHGTNDPSTIGKFVSSGCIRMTNEDVIDLFGRVNVGSKVVVLPKNAPLMAKGADAAHKWTRPAVTTNPPDHQALNISSSSLN